MFRSECEVISLKYIHLSDKFMSINLINTTIYMFDASKCHIKSSKKIVYFNNRGTISAE